MHGELINTTSRTIEVCKTTFRDACNEIKFNVYYNKKKSKLTLSIKKNNDYNSIWGFSVYIFPIVNWYLFDTFNRDVTENAIFEQYFS